VDKPSPRGVQNVVRKETKADPSHRGELFPAEDTKFIDRVPSSLARVMTIPFSNM
jgi:hypothetical protein